VTGRPDARLGQTVAAYIQPVAGVDGQELMQRLQQRCTREMAKYKVPAHWVIVEALPRNAMGKIVKSRLSPLDGGSR
jgi:long-chain acyl-CoA synthetase